MSDWSLSHLLANLHEDIQVRLARARSSFSHPGVKGDASENVWLSLLQTYLPERYRVERAHAVDSTGRFSDQLDIVVFDRQYSPFIFNYEKQLIIPAESIYAVFEAKQTVNAKQVSYAQDKVASVRRLHRTSIPIPHAGGTFPAKPPIPILGGILALESDWRWVPGNSFEKALDAGSGDQRLNIGCVAAHGYFQYDDKKTNYEMHNEATAATAFLFALISRLQFSATVPMIDINAYGKWLLKD